MRKVRGMKVEIYRGVPFIDREEEIEFFVDWFNKVPQRILWVYGPKSSGKTTVIEYVIEKRLLPQKKWWIKYFNMRETLITSYNSFLDTFFVDVRNEDVEKEGRIGINVIGFKAEVLERVRRKQENLFKVFIAKIREILESGRRPTLIIDEIQKLRDLYMENGNGEREFLKEFLNFCVRLTKETHLSHVVILTSNTVFTERIYNDARMKKTSQFYKVDHLSFEKIKEWLRLEGFNEDEIEFVWRYSGGCVSDLLKVIEVKRQGRDLKEFFDREAWLAYTEIDEFLAVFSDEEVEFFTKVAEEIVKRGYYSIRGLKEDKRKFLQRWAEKEILFYDPLELRVVPNSRIYAKGLEILLERI